MKIVKRERFLQMRPGTLFAKYQPCYFEELSIKGVSIGSEDFSFQEIVASIDSRSSADFAEKLAAAELEGISLAMDFEIESRDGCFDPEQLFAVFERDDLLQLLQRLMRAYQIAYANP